MMPYPKISVITTNFNGAEFLERTIQSVLFQQYPNLEYIIIDGNSTDNSVDIIRRYESQIAFWVSESDSGMYEALQKGLARSTGDIMAWLNSDDLYHGKSLFQVAEIFSDFPQIKWLTGVPTAIDEHDNVMVPQFSDYPVWSKIRFYSYDYEWIQQESTFWKRDLWTKAGGSLDTTLKYAGDFELWLRFFRYELLYATPILIAGFRMRRYGQKSVLHRGAYIEEARRSLKNELSKLSVLNHLLLPFSYIDRILISIPGLKKIYAGTGFRKILGYPPKMYFNSERQKLELKT